MQPVVRALAILDAIAAHRGGLSLQELADVVELPPSTTHRLATVLEAQRYLMRTPQTKRFMLGPAIRGLVSSTSSDHVRRVAEPLLLDLNRRTGETVFLAELVGGEVVCFWIAEGTGPLRLFVALGRALPLHAAASARVILAHLDQVTLAALLDASDFEEWTPRTLTDRGALLRHLAVVRQRGFDICDDEMPNHEWAVAAPLHDVSGVVCASVAVVAPLSNVADAKRRGFLQELLVVTARTISAELGAAPTVERNASAPSASG